MISPCLESTRFHINDAYNFGVRNIPTISISTVCLISVRTKNMVLLRFSV